MFLTDNLLLEGSLNWTEMQGGTLCLGSVSLACHSGHGVIALYVTKTFGYYIYVPKILG